MPYPVLAQVIELAPQLRKALPNSKAVFLYRDAIPTAESFCKGFFTTWVTKLVCTARHVPLW